MLRGRADGDCDQVGAVEGAVGEADREVVLAGGAPVSEQLTLGEEDLPRPFQSRSESGDRGEVAESRE